MDKNLAEIAEIIRRETLKEKEFNELLRIIERIIKNIPRFGYRKRTSDDIDTLILTGIEKFLEIINKNKHVESYTGYLYKTLQNEIDWMDKDLSNKAYLKFKKNLKGIILVLENEGEIISNEKRITDKTEKLKNGARNIDEIFAQVKFGEYIDNLSRWTMENKKKVGEIVKLILRKLDGFILLHDFIDRLAAEMGFEKGGFVDIGEKNVDNEDDSRPRKPLINIADDDIPNNIIMEVREEITDFIKHEIFNFHKEREKNIKPFFWYYHTCEKLTLKEISAKFGWPRSSNADYYFREKFKIAPKYKFLISRVLRDFDFDERKLLLFFENEFCLQLKNFLDGINHEK
jgi:AraC-like DNA-binding protein